MAFRSTHARRLTIALFCCGLLVLGCTSADSDNGASTGADPTPTVDGPSTTTSRDGDDESAENLNDAPGADDPTPTAAPMLRDEDLASITEVALGAQVEDAAGNLLAVYGLVRWPEPFASLSEASRSAFPFVGDIATLNGSAGDLVAIDVAMCAAGLDSGGSGTADFFLHGGSDDPLSNAPILDRGLLPQHPVVQPAFDFPKAAECERGWLPVMWSGQGEPVVARYVLASRSAPTAEIERFVYQWTLDDGPVEAVNAPSTAADEVIRFAAGETVTFNDGSLAASRATVAGWSELVGKSAPIEGTRLVAVSLTWCPGSGSSTPQTGLGVDGWNIVAPVDSVSLGDPGAGEAESCFDDRIEFAVPHGAIPTAFFVSDGDDSVTGYAEWSLSGAALPVPQ